MVTLVILPTTLFDKKYYPKNIKKIIVWEHPHYFKKYNYNKKKLILHRASLKKYFDLIDKKYKKQYITYNVSFKLSNYVCFDPIDNLKLKGTLLESPGFLLSSKDINEYLKAKKDNKKLLFNNFYTWAKKKLNIIPNIKSQDKHNRKILPKNTIIPKVPKYKNKYINEAQEYIKLNFHNNYGNYKFDLPITNTEAVKIFENFIKYKYKYFGDYQDYTSTHNEEYNILYHTYLSSSINIGLITPEYIIKKLPHKPLNSYEGLIRQYFWREYQRLCYVCRDRWVNNNYFSNRLKLDKKWYLGTLGVKPIDDIIKEAFETGYLHHIKRLMFMANFMNLYGIDPKEGMRWFIEFAIDSYEWVMYQNVLDMGFFVSGGYTMRKPYISSSNYIIKMSDYKKGQWSVKWDELYHKFLKKHKKLLYPFRYHFSTLKY